MKLYMHPASPFARKARVIARELDLMQRVQEIAAMATSEEVRRINPLGKIPVLILDDGSSLIDSPVICEYLNETGGGKFFPGMNLWRGSSGRWRALGLQAIGDGIADAAVARTYETRRPDGEKSKAFLDKQEAIVARAVDVLERVKFAETPTIGEVAVACAIGYVEFRMPDFAWRDSHPNLTAWYETFLKFPSMAATMPGDLK